MIDSGDIDVFLGLDVGKGDHHATAVTPAGKKAFDKRLPNTEPKLRELFTKLQAKHGTVLVVVDQPGLDWSLTAGGRADHGLPVRLPAWIDDATDRRPPSRRGQDRREGRVHHRGRGPRDIAYADRTMPHTLR
ncbi:insertion element IS110 uncharacterized 43.6 kDa protein [Streptomyces olivochromogenes]|uniref:Insertion element IS110 uncharacterized 43.6 kDa protein n=1 Tax=Streptomyces olivochromogenes TaxID=1963 RepID=A0A286PGC3_STROL|nr:insertion element IS110 uncharacterized 43.6 kDa protein [Streptomyces olivochromogenes]